jgi:NAD(P)-dependent dehydrogenase (short-subunit alcohol dehydrogenase family)
MDLGLGGKIALVTGSSRGIGRGVALTLAQEGCDLMLTGRDEAALREVVGEVEKRGRKAAFEVIDLRADGAAAALVEAARRRYGRLDILVNNAGVTIGVATDQIALTDWQRVIDTNLTGAFLCSREALKIMKSQKGGRIINIGSISSITPRPNGAPYAATKLALEGLTRSIALDYREYNIGASIIHLGATASGWMKVKPEQATGPDYHLALDDVGRLAVFIASLPAEANMFETTILPIQQRSFIGRG